MATAASDTAHSAIADSETADAAAGRAASRAARHALLGPEETLVVLGVLSACLTGATVWVFGSRATGRARPFSDLDLLVLAPQPSSWAQHAALRDAFEASTLPFRVDVVDATELAAGMREQVEAEKILLFGGG